MYTWTTIAGPQYWELGGETPSERRNWMGQRIVYESDEDKRVREIIGPPPKDPFQQAMMFGIGAAMAGMVATIIAGVRDEGFAAAWTGILVGAGAFFYYRHEENKYYVRRVEITARDRPPPLKRSPPLKNGSMRTEQLKVGLDACVAARKFGADFPREAAEMTAGRPLTDEEWGDVKQLWEDAWDKMLLNGRG